MMSFGGYGKPGQRESSRRSPETEVTITVKQALWATIGLFTLFLIIQRVVVIGVGRSIVARWPDSATAVQRSEILIWRVFVGVAIGFPAYSLAASMLVNVFDQNHPAPYSARDPEAGPAAPGIVRRMVGYRGVNATTVTRLRDIVTNMLEAATAERGNRGNNKSAPINNVAPRSTDRKHRVGSVAFSGISLPREAFEKLTLMAQRGTPFSIREMKAVHVPNPRDVSAALSDAQLTYKDGKNMLPDDKFAAWLIERGWEQ